MGALKELCEKKVVKQIFGVRHLGFAWQICANCEDNQEPMSTGRARATCDLLGVLAERSFHHGPFYDKSAGDMCRARCFLVEKRT